MRFETCFFYLCLDYTITAMLATQMVDIAVLIFNMFMESYVPT